MLDKMDVARFLKGEFAGINDFEVVAFLMVLPEGAA